MRHAPRGLIDKVKGGNAMANRVMRFYDFTFYDLHYDFTCIFIVPEPLNLHFIIDFVRS